MRDKESFLKQFALLESRISKIEKTTRKGIDNYTLYVDTAMCLQWKTQVVTLLRQIYPLRLFPQWLNKEDIASSRKTNFRVAVGIFNAAYEDFKNGLLDDLQAEIECGVAVYYLQQARKTLGIFLKTVSPQTEKLRKF